MPKIKHLVVDTNAFIKNIQLQELGEAIYTVRNVLDEIRDRQTRARLDCLPYELEIRQPSDESIALVTKFSKATGDYAALSKADILVMALAHTLHLEHAVDIPLRTEPVKNNDQVVTFDKDKSAAADNKILGFVQVGRKKRNKNTNNHENNDNEDEVEEEEEEDKNEQDEEEEEENENDDDEESEDDDEGWITPSNYKSELHCDEIPTIVGCYTSDFAMQNTLLSIGLEIISPDGQRVRKLKTWTLRCYGCFKLVNDLDKKFCPRCGNATLKRVSVTVDENGVKKIHLNPRVKITSRGKRFPLPPPKGGKHVVEPILCADQKICLDKQTKANRRINDVFRDDLVAGTSPFLQKDVNSRSAFLHHSTKYWERKNPNASHK